jgi:aminocarboxymuconate-semialdehyde decarboxylase
MIYDVHAHCIPAEFRDWLERQGAPLGAAVVATEKGPAVRFADRVTTGAFREDLTDRELRLAELDRMGIDVQVLAGWIDLTGYELSGQAAVAYSNAHNEALAAEAASAPDRYRALGTVPLQDPDAAVAVLDRAVNEFGMRGVEIATTVDGIYPDRRRGLDAFWQAAEDMNAFVLLHPMRPLGGIDMDPYFMENMVARPAESTIALAGLILSGVFERFPGLRLCIVHGGGFAPFQIGRLDKGYRQKPKLVGAHISKPPSEYLKSLYVDTVVHEPAALDYLIRFLGADRIMLGTDYPFEMGDQDPVTFVKSIPGITEADVSAITGGNAAALFG